MILYENLVKQADKTIGLFHKELTALNDDIADHPEIGGMEFRTVRIMTQLLKDKGYTVEAPYAGVETAYRAIYGDNQHKYKIALMAEYDALPEIGHGCGHCLSGSISILAVLALKELQDALNADIHIIGTPDEETNGGKPKLIRGGGFDGYDMAMMIHLYNANQLYTKVMAIDTFTHYFHGKAAHASAAPWEGHNAFNAAQLFFHGMDMLRQHVKPEVQMHGIIRNSGEAPNIVPEEVSVELYTRGFDRPYLNEVNAKIDDCARGAAIATQTKWEKKATAEVFDSMKLIPFGNEILKEIYEELEIPLNGNPECLFGSSDCGNVSRICPTFQPTLQVVEQDVPIHTREFAEAMKTERAHSVLFTGARVMARQVIKLFSEEKNIQQLKKSFEEAKG